MWKIIAEGDTKPKMFWWGAKVLLEMPKNRFVKLSTAVSFLPHVAQRPYHTAITEVCELFLQLQFKRTTIEEPCT